MHKDKTRNSNKSSRFIGSKKLLYSLLSKNIIGIELTI